ncbi:MAG: class I SAM-dependent methyltransferase [Armatimonadota bacterium]|nr:class I SAM-dependent methyltransferase [Armatimonadota bacterium]
MNILQFGSSTAICNICRSVDCYPLIHKDGHDVYRCRGCGLVFTHPLPEELYEQYDARYFDLYRRRRQFRLKRADARLRQIELIMRPGKLLDIGCSLGYFLEAAKSRGWDAWGIDVSDYAVNEARKLGLNVRVGDLEQVGFETGSFDCVTMWDVLEHVPDPTSHMREVRRVLATGGLVVIGTPNADHLAFRIKREKWRHFKPAEHVYYFGRFSIETLLRNTGFKPVRPSVLAPAVFVGHLGARIRALLSLIVQPNDVMTVYARAEE